MFSTKSAAPISISASGKPACAARSRAYAALVVRRPGVEPAGEADELLRVRLRREGRDDARVEAAADVGADRHVRAQVQPDGVVHQLADLLLEVGARVAEVGAVVDLPVPPRLDLPVADAEDVARQQLVDPLEQGLAAEAELEREVVLERLQVGLDRRQEGQQRLDLGGEVEDAVDDRVVERLDPEAVAGAEERVLLLVPEREREHPAQVRHAVLAPGGVAVRGSSRCPSSSGTAPAPSSSRSSR